MNISEVFSPAPANVMLFNLQAEGAVCSKSCDAAWNHKSHCVQLFRPENNWSPDWAWFLPSFFPSIPITWRSFGSLARSHLAWNLTELNLFHNWQILQHQHFFFPTESMWCSWWFWGPWDVLTCPDICAYFSYCNILLVNRSFFVGRLGWYQGHEVGGQPKKTTT